METERSITEREVRHVADLARLELTSEEVKQLTSQLHRILSYVAQLRELDTSGVEPTAHVLLLRNVFREDEVRVPLLEKEALANAPRREKGHFVVPKIIE